MREDVIKIKVTEKAFDKYVSVIYQTNLSYRKPEAKGKSCP